MIQAILRKVKSFLQNNDTSEDSENKTQDTSLTFSEVVIFYNFVFDLGKNVNPISAARQLLKRDFSIAFANPYTQQVEIASRFKSLRNLRTTVQNLSLLEKYRGEDKWSSIFWWLVIHPLQAFNIIKLFFQGKGNVNHQKGLSGSDDAVKKMRETIDLINSSIRGIQEFEDLHRQADEILFSPLYLKEAPFVRVGLQPVYIETGEDKVWADVWVLIHRTGLAILTFGVMFDKNKTTDDLIHLQYTTKRHIITSEVVKDILLDQASSEGINKKDLESFPSSKRFSSGVEWFKYNHGEPISLSDIFNLYQISIISNIHNKTPMKRNPIESWVRSEDWFAYPIVFIRNIQSEGKMLNNINAYHLQEIGGIVWRYANWKSISPEKLQEIDHNDLALSNSYRLHIEASHTTLLYYNSYSSDFKNTYGDSLTGARWLFHHYQTSSVIEAVLIQKWTLHILRCQLNKLPRNLDKLNKLKEDMIFGLDDYHNPIFSFGSAQDIVMAVKKAINLEEDYKSVILKFDNMEKLIQAEESRANSRRSLFLNISITILTLVSSLPGVEVITDNLYKWNMLPMGKDIASQIAYSLIVLLVVLSLVWNILPKWNKKSIIELDQSHSARQHKSVWPDN